MVKFLAYDPETLYQEVKKRALAEGAFSQEAYYELVEEVVDEQLGFGEMPDDDEYEEVTEVLRNRWSDFEQETEKSDEVGY